MATLWDRIHHEPAPVPLNGVEAFDVTPILRMHLEDPCDDYPYLWPDLPNIAPPFKQYFMFGSVRLLRASGREALVNGDIGVLFRAERRRDGNGWEMFAAPVGGSNRCVLWQRCVLNYSVDPSGKFVDSGQKYFRLFYQQGMTPIGRLRGASADEIVSGVSGLIYPFLLATSILHCKNVTATRVRPPVRLARAMERRGRPLYTHSVLDIAPMRRVLEDEGSMGRGASFVKALHMCRGHFKDYRDGAGLFGRHKGVFWWDQAMRGDVKAGVHVKDYRVHACEAIA